MLTVGILGGMGPMATVDLFGKIVESTPAKKDQDHLKIIVYDNPQIPSRVEAIISGTESPLPELVRSAKFLEQAGADIIVMPCNTAHYWYQDIQNAITVKLMNMIDNTAVQLKANNPNGDSGYMLFATAATIKTGIYQKAFEVSGLKLVTPEPAEQKVVSAAIDQVKAGHIGDNQYLNELEQIICKYCAMGVSSFIAGCTEIPLIFEHLTGDFTKIDPTRLLAEEVVRQAM